LGHNERIEDSEMPKRMIKGKLYSKIRKRRPRMRWPDDFESDLKMKVKRWKESMEAGFRGGQGSPRAAVVRAVEIGFRGGQGSPRAAVVRAVEVGFRGGQGSPRAAVVRAVEAGFRGGQGSPRVAVPSGRNGIT
jgi:hypothetical protein